MARIDACGGDELVGGGLRILGGAAVHEDGGAALGELPGGFEADAGVAPVTRTVREERSESDMIHSRKGTGTPGGPVRD
ncbi:hypothetical protein RB199_37680 [Streptomyces libani]|uniref:hypothetical protein n=1 Tax=Streptomyces nigrescens TaxID=1920 RepID=UPI00302C0460